jgi:hypothetical protein
MKGFATLLRLADSRTEELRVSLADAERAREAALARVQMHQTAMLDEARLHHGNSDGLRDWSSWQAKATQTDRALRGALVELTSQAEQCRDRMRDSVADGRRMELAIAARLEAQQLRTARKREAAAEEVALRQRVSG